MGGDDASCDGAPSGSLPGGSELASTREPSGMPEGVSMVVPPQPIRKKVKGAIAKERRIFQEH